MALFVSLIFLVVLTLIGLAAFSNNTLQSRMAYSTSETNLAFQSAESGLISGETWLATRTEKPVADCVSGSTNDNTCIWPRASLIGASLEDGSTPIVPVSTANLASETWWVANGREFGKTYAQGTGAPTQVTGQTIAGVAAQPRYVIEDLGTDLDCPPSKGQVEPYCLRYFLITARGFGAQDNARTLVQSVFAKGF